MKYDKSEIIATCAIIIAYIAFIGFFGYIIWHFISKFW